jgi:LysR family pca operon transcriptional activator
VARQKSVVKAARALNVTQPAVSKTLRELEVILDVKLFDRSRRGVTLTRFGDVFLRYAGASVTALRQGVDSITQARAKGGYKIAVGALPTVAAQLMPQAIQAFKQDGVETSVSVVTGLNTVLLSQLRVGDLDLVVGRLSEPELMTGLSFEHLYSERISFLVRPGHPLLQDGTFDLKRLRDFTVLMPNETSIIRPLVDRLLIANGVAALPDTIETVSMAFGRHYARNSDAVWIISHGVAADDIADGMLIELPVDTHEYVGPVGLTTRADTPPGPSARLLIQSIREVVSSQDYS